MRSGLGHRMQDLTFKLDACTLKYPSCERCSRYEEFHVNYVKNEWKSKIKCRSWILPQYLAQSLRFQVFQQTNSPSRVETPKLTKVFVFYLFATSNCSMGAIQSWMNRSQIYSICYAKQKFRTKNSNTSLILKFVGHLDKNTVFSQQNLLVFTQTRAGSFRCL